MLCSFQKNYIPISKILLGSILGSLFLAMAALGQEQPTPVLTPAPVQPTPSPTGVGAQGSTNVIQPQPVGGTVEQPTAVPAPSPAEPSEQFTSTPQVQTGTPVRGLW